MEWVIWTKNSKMKTLASVIIVGLIGVPCRLWARYLNKTQCHNLNELLDLINRGDKSRPLITFSNHDSCIDDPMVLSTVMPLSVYLRPSLNKDMRWSLGAQEVVYRNKWQGYMSSLCRVLPIVRANGVYQPVMNRILEELNNGCWLHIFPEGKVNDKRETLRLKWGIGRLIADAEKTPVVLPFYFLGMDDILPNRRPYRLRTGNHLTVFFGKPMHFEDIVKDLKQKNKSPMEMRKIITDLIQEEFYRVKKITQDLHEKHISGGGSGDSPAQK